MLPTALILGLFLAYPLLKGIWLSFTNTRIGREGVFIGLENYEWLWDDDVFWLSVFNTCLYNGGRLGGEVRYRPLPRPAPQQKQPFKAIVRSIVLIPFVVPTVLSAIAFWWIFDSQFSIISWSSAPPRVINGNIDFLGDPRLRGPA